MPISLTWRLRWQYAQYKRQRNELSYRNDTIIVFVFAVTNTEDETKIALTSSNA